MLFCETIEYSFIEGLGMKAWQTSVLAVTSVALCCLSTPPGLAQTAVPIQKEGACPTGYYTSGNYCVPRTNAKYAIFKNGACPSGYYTSGNYCMSRK